MKLFCYSIHYFGSWRYMLWLFEILPFFSIYNPCPVCIYSFSWTQDWRSDWTHIDRGRSWMINFVWVAVTQLHLPKITFLHACMAGCSNGCVIDLGTWMLWGYLTVLSTSLFQQNACRSFPVLSFISCLCIYLVASICIFESLWKIMYYITFFTIMALYSIYHSFMLQLCFAVALSFSPVHFCSCKHCTFLL